MTEPCFPLLGLSRHRIGIDGAGVTTLVAGADCPLSCAYCINKNLLCQAPKQVSPQELFDRVKVDDLYFRATNGGLCFGGGESLLHLNFIEALRPLCPGWHLTAETSLHVPPETARRAMTLFDDFIVDVKSTDPAVYRRYTGCDPEAAYENLRLYAQTLDPARILVRVPIIPGYQDEAARDRCVQTLRAWGVRGEIDAFSYVVPKEVQP